MKIWIVGYYYEYEAPSGEKYFTKEPTARKYEAELKIKHNSDIEHVYCYQDDLDET